MFVHSKTLSVFIILQHICEYSEQKQRSIQICEPLIQFHFSASGQSWESFSSSQVSSRLTTRGSTAFLFHKLSTSHLPFAMYWDTNTTFTSGSLGRSPIRNIIIIIIIYSSIRSISHQQVFSICSNPPLNTPLQLLPVSPSG
jgi:hypothetical protein